ncbi:hypothetical protein SLEP1_g59107 [Rubroshorea leprosula]|uniref:Sulfotransferase n=1 Tax=Rubroshorea leprosula TaxID=152421 RepID=A0AAV5MTU3_9ROSI|nr:hypothetical protein SLEP1_g59107 [Rubroshorea leprosula]
MEEEAISPATMERMRKTISSLPNDNGWRLPFPFYFYEGFSISTLFLEGIILAQELFQAEPSDIFICSPPKSGTTWIKALTFAIVTRTHFQNSTNPLLSKTPHDILPFYETIFSKRWPHIRQPGIPLIATHTPYTLLPKSVQDSDCKIVYVCRDPKDVFVSLFHFFAKVRFKEHEPISLEEAFEMFCEGKSSFGPYWNHVLGYWKASLERPKKVLFLKYEDMMTDTALYVKKIAEFVGYPFSLEEEEEGMVEKIVEMCSFEFLSNLEVNREGAVESLSKLSQNNLYFRKGKVGDWKNYLTLEMADRLNKITEQKLSGSGLTLNAS